jgi:hypothetical protein
MSLYLYQVLITNYILLKTDTIHILIEMNLGRTNIIHVSALQGYR